MYSLKLIPSMDRVSNRILSGAVKSYSFYVPVGFINGRIEIS